MPLLSKPSVAARTSVMYITAALVDVWTIIYWTYLVRHPEGHTDATYYWVYGFFFTGLVLLVIGLALGRIGRAARHAELPPEAPNEQPPNLRTRWHRECPPPLSGQATVRRVLHDPSPVAMPAAQNGGPVAATPAIPSIPAVTARQGR